METEIFDLKEALDGVGGDKEFFKEIVGEFLKACPEQLTAIRDSIARSDSKALERTAHALKGNVGPFYAKRAVEAALKLEVMGRGGDLAHAQEEYAILEKEIDRVRLALETAIK
ncbi:MAG: Hpt domain-containing protein [Verrucomicrobia bacterium]|nr:Hpt domain-containing protein [Verrucomicrobiota bacterium]